MAKFTITEKEFDDNACQFMFLFIAGHKEYDHDFETSLVNLGEIAFVADRDQVCFIQHTYWGRYLPAREEQIGKPPYDFGGRAIVRYEVSEIFAKLRQYRNGWVNSDLWHDVIYDCLKEAMEKMKSDLKQRGVIVG